MNVLERVIISVEISAPNSKKQNHYDILAIPFFSRKKSDLTRGMNLTFKITSLFLQVASPFPSRLRFRTFFTMIVSLHTYFNIVFSI